MKIESRNIFASMKENVFTSFLVIMAILLTVMMAVSIVIFLRNSARDQDYLALVGDLRVNIGQLTTQSRDASNGSEPAFTALEQTLSQMQRTWDQLRNSDQGTRTALASQFAQYNAVWDEVRNSTQTIIASKENVTFMTDVAATLKQSLPELQAEHNSIRNILEENNAPTNQVAASIEQIWRLERILRNVDRMLAGGEESAASADQFNSDASLFGAYLDALKSGNATLGITRVTDPEAIQSLNDITELFDFVNSSVQEIFETRDSLFGARQSSEKILDDSPKVVEALGSLSNGISSQTTTRQPNTMTIIVLAALAAICFAWVGTRLYQSQSKRANETANTNERNQNAILRLLDELADLADGDLTTTATVTEDFTGAIADSINYTIDQLRILVSRINETAVNVARAAQDTQQTALHLAEASEHQAQEIAGASAAVNEMAVTIDQVSANAAESASVAERSVSIASNGAKVVQNTIHGMDTIREQIQDTSKRIKRLGESSQEIGDIVSLINDIADQTNILALNAAIQASMAGDAGRGFAVVADEVQRLAERSAAATKQIEALVKTIQNDTNEAVISMEQTTAEVVRGARLAQDAGVALEEIENVSSSLAELIQNISNAARQQASSAGHISNTMNVIQEITSQTSAGTGATAESIGNLASMAADLRESVAGFTLPEELGVRATQEMPVVMDDANIATLEEAVDLSMDSAVDGDYDEDLEMADFDDGLDIDLMSEDDDQRSATA